MNRTEQDIKIAAKLYKCRGTAIKFFREKYFERVAPYMNIIQGVMEAEKKDEMESFLIISKTEAFLENGMGQMMFMAALVELIEPTFIKTEYETK